MVTAEEFIKDMEKKCPGKVISMKDIGRETRLKFTVEACTLIQQNNMPEKVFIIERLRKENVDINKLAYPHVWKVGSIEYRIGYYIIGKIGKKKDKWTWGQFCPIIPQEDLDKLIKKAEKEGTILK